MELVKKENENDSDEYDMPSLAGQFPEDPRVLFLWRNISAA